LSTCTPVPISTRWVDLIALLFAID